MRSKDYDRQYQAARYQRVMAKCRKALGGSCVVCGTKKNLHFDHIDPKTKTKTIARLWNRPWMVIEIELRKCQLLCEKHHIAKHQQEGDYAKNILLGEKRPNAKLTEAAVRRIRNNKTARSLRSWARELGVSQGLISQVQRNLIWKHVV